MCAPTETLLESTSRTLLTLAAAMTLIFSVAISSGAEGSAHAQQATGKQAADQNAKTAPLHGDKLTDAVCSTCHGPHGNKTIDPKYPKIAGQQYSYMLQQLRAFKSGTRKSEVMSTVLADISNAQLAELARFYSEQAAKPNTVKDRRLADLGARVFNSSGRGTPSCAGCHSARGYGQTIGRGGMGMMGNTANVPKLFGQNVDYTVQQLDDFASGKRRGTVMGAIAARLPEQYRRAVADYLSGQR